ncbi:hypothetical protein ACGFZL_04250 [Streptomyces sp. NPDC048182]|uniref:hypothetical protein n=1 Tax=Streptomyces sp. NPDC048182 TaxID=3365507 RepID=UPI00371EE35B
MKLSLTLVTILGGLLPLAAVIWGSVSLRRDYRRLVNDLTAIDAIIQAPEGTHADRSAAMRAVREPKYNAGRLMYSYEWTQRLVWEQAMDDLRGPAWLAGAGLVLATVAGAWSIWI